MGMFILASSVITHKNYRAGQQIVGGAVPQGKRLPDMGRVREESQEHCSEQKKQV